MGTAYAVEHFLNANTWDKVTREFKITPIPGQITVHEFDHKAVNEVVYQENGVTIRTIPAIHAGDGPVSFILEYAGLKAVFGGDTSPNTWFVEHARNADFVIHEAFNPPQIFATLGNQPQDLAWRACCQTRRHRERESRRSCGRAVRFPRSERRGQGDDDPVLLLVGAGTGWTGSRVVAAALALWTGGHSILRETGAAQRPRPQSL
jgi:hypothetical protein